MLNTRLTSSIGITAALVMCLLALPEGTVAQQGLNRAEQMIEARSQEQPQPSAHKVAMPPGVNLDVLPVLGNVYLIAGGPSNLVVQTGSEGVLVVDTATADISDRALQAIRVLSKGPINYVVNTSGDPDHYGGNEKISTAGENPTRAGNNLAGPGSGAPPAGGGGNNPQELRPDGAIVFAHENVLNRMSAPTGEKPPVAFALWPTNTFFTLKKTFWFNDESIELLHTPAAHTDGDVMVFFRHSDVIAAGDIINTDAYPSFDAKRGGTIQGLLNALNDVIDLAVPRFNQQGGTRIVPGHGRILNEADVVEYRDMTTIIRDRVKLGIEQRMTLAEIKALQPTLDYDGLYSTREWTGETFVSAIYAELKTTAGR